MLIKNSPQSYFSVQHDNSHKIAASFNDNQFSNKETSRDSDACTMNCPTLTDTGTTRSRSVLFPAFDENILTSDARTCTEKTDGDPIFMINEMLMGVINQCVVEKDEETLSTAKGNLSINELYNKQNFIYKQYIERSNLNFLFTFLYFSHRQMHSH